MDNSRQIVFKTSTLGGFEKKAVLDYIYNLNEENLIAQIQLSEQIEALSAADATRAEEIRLANEQLEQAQKEANSIRAELTQERSHSAELDKLNEMLKVEISRYRDHFKEVQAENEKMQRELEELRDTSKSLHSRQSEMDQTITSVGKLMVDARNNADGIIAQAKVDAAKITEDTNVTCQLQLSKARDEATLIIADAREKSALLLDQSTQAAQAASVGFQSFCRDAAAIQSAVSDMLASYEEKACTISKLLESSGKPLDDAKNPAVSQPVVLAPKAEINTSAKLLDIPEVLETPEINDHKPHSENFFRSNAGAG